MKPSREAPKAPTESAVAERPAGGAIVGAATPGRGFESGVDNDDLIFPRAQLVQAMSPSVKLGARPGTIINSLTLNILPKTFVPIFMFKNWIRFNPRKESDHGYDRAFEPGAIIWRSNDANDKRVLTECAFGAEGEKPLGTTFMNFFAYFPGVDMPVTISFAKTSYKAGKNLFSLCKFMGGDMFSRKYDLTMAEEIKGKDSYYVFKTAAAGRCSPEERQLGEALWTQFHSKKDKIDAVDADVVDAEPAPGADRPY